MCRSRMLSRLLNVGTPDATSSQFQLVHLATRFVITKVVVMPNHLAVGVAKPTHHDLLGNPVVRAGAAEVMAEAV